MISGLFCPLKLLKEPLYICRACTSQTSIPGSHDYGTTKWPVPGHGSGPLPCSVLPPHGKMWSACSQKVQMCSFFFLGLK